MNSTNLFSAKILSVLIVLGLTVLSFTDIESHSNSRDAYYEEFGLFMINHYDLQLCDKDCPDGGQGAACAPASFTGCSTQSMCTCLDYSAPYATQVANCLGIPVLTPTIWNNLTSEQRNMPCVVGAIEPHLIPFGH